MDVRAGDIGSVVPDNTIILWNKKLDACSDLERIDS